MCVIVANKSFTKICFTRDIIDDMQGIVQFDFMMQQINRYLIKHVLVENLLLHKAVLIKSRVCVIVLQKSFEEK